MVRILNFLTILIWQGLHLDVVPFDSYLLFRSKCLITLTEHENKIRAIAFSHDGQLLLSGSEDGTSKLWNMEQAECLQTMIGHAGGVWAVAISHNDQLLFTGSQDHTIKIWRTGCGECQQTLKDHHSTITALAITSIGTIVIN